MADMDEKDMPDDKVLAGEKVLAGDQNTPTDEKLEQGTTPATAASESPATATPALAGSGRPIEWTASDARGPLVTAAEAHGGPHTETKPETAEEPADPESSADHASPAADPVVPQPISDAPEKRSFVPVAAGIVIGALIGAGSAAGVYAWMGGGAGPVTAADPQVAGLVTRVDALEKRPDGQAAISALQSSVADLGAKIATLEKKSGEVPAAAAAAPSASSAPPPATVDLAPLQQKIAALQASLDTLKAQGGDSKGLEAKVAALESDVAGAKKESSTAQAGIASVAGQQKALSDKVMVPALAVVADSLVRQIEQGQPYVPQVDALAALGADPAKIAILRQGADKGVPSAKMLATAFEPLAEPISATAHKAPPNAGFVDRLKSGMFSMVSVRSVDDTSGTDLPSRVARIQTDLAHDDVADALATWDALPADAKTKGDAWAALAKTTLEAMNAARALQHDAIAALGTKKS